ncbi:MAG: hypothetical protein P3W87_001495 [Gammaproteobacteria bacterium]|nr:hypothetical protein [Gammaproteobacteria bacterium]
MIRLGSFDWRHAAWQGRFYPEDLPEDWQLAFYANEFDALGLAAEAWFAPSLEELAGWVKDTREGFYFYPELPAWQVPDLEVRLKVLGPRLGAILAGAGCPSELIELAGHFASVWAQGAVEGLPQVAHDFVEALEPGRAPLVVLKSSRVNLRAARKAMEVLGLRAGVILMRDAGIALESLQRLRTLRNFLGWP